jgi:hypothetical protein
MIDGLSSRTATTRSQLLALGFMSIPIQWRTAD